MKAYTDVIWLFVCSALLSGIVLGCGPGAPPPPQITEQEKSMAISAIMDDPAVKDAAVTQQGRTLSLALIVGEATSEPHAKKIGERFVRLVKTFSKDAAPERQIGEGVYDYLVGVYYPGQIRVAMGAKVAIASAITW